MKHHELLDEKLNSSELRSEVLKEKLNSTTKELLRTKVFLTSRGIFEWTARKIHAVAELKRRIVYTEIFRGAYGLKKVGLSCQLCTYLTS